MHSVLTDHVKFRGEGIEFAKHTLKLSSKVRVFFLELAMTFFVMRVSMAKNFDLESLGSVWKAIHTRQVLQTHVFVTPVDDQVKIVLLVHAQCLTHSVLFIWFSYDVHLPAIWTEQVSYPPSSSVQMMMVMVMSRCRARWCFFAFDQSCWCRGHGDNERRWMHSLSDERGRSFHLETICTCITPKLWQHQSALLPQ